jgi:3-oxoacyl-[acyl-carrier-protein] synthase II
MFISASSGISHQPSFRNSGFSSALQVLPKNSEILHPDYAGFIAPMERRRMSDAVKMAIACAMDCIRQSGVSEPEGIVVGTSMGCCQHTRNFMDKILESEGGLIAPTSFILSTHNTIAGQISLVLGNRNYNITHTQDSLSFEHALTDARLCVELDGSAHVLAGASDELEQALYSMDARLKRASESHCSGAAFFMISGSPVNDTNVRLKDVAAMGNIADAASELSTFMALNKLQPEDIDLLLFAGSDAGETDILKAWFGADKMIDYQTFSGTYFTNSAFAMHCAIDALLVNKHPGLFTPLNRVLILNHLIPENLGLILLEKPF